MMLGGRKKKIENPYHQDNTFPNIPRILFLSFIFGVPIICFLNREYIEESLFGIQSKYVLSSRSLHGPLSSKSSFSNDVDPNLKTMTFQFPDENEPRTFDAYVQPELSSFYKGDPPSTTIQEPRFKGLAGKFVNFSPDHLQLFWDDGRNGMHIADLPPFQAAGTATFPVHRFFFSKRNGDTKDIVHRVHIQPNQNLYIYDAFEEGHAEVEDLTDDLLELYNLQKKNLYFAKEYRKFTGRDWISFYPTTKKPIYKMWNADYFGQQHWVTTTETHFVVEPPEDLLTQMTHDEMFRDRVQHPDIRNLTEYRSKEPLLNMTMTVLSVSPRVFEVKSFLSQQEVDHIVHMATGMKLSLSTTSATDGKDATSNSKSRTSHNSWVGRARSPIMDSIYTRAADLMRLDEALLRQRHKDEIPEIDHRSSNAEDLQLVHYARSEEYTAHHDFTYPPIHSRGQPARWSTLLLYLNEGMEGGDTCFPRYVNAETTGKLCVTPEIGKAVLFYDQLPDGNMDDFSQHAAEPVRKGEKWLINLWTWNPRFH